MILLGDEDPLQQFAGAVVADLDGLGDPAIEPFDGVVFEAEI